MYFENIKQRIGYFRNEYNSKSQASDCKTKVRTLKAYSLNTTLQNKKLDNKF